VQRDIPASFKPRHVLRRRPQKAGERVLRVATGLAELGDASPYVPDDILRTKGHAVSVDFTSTPKKGTMGL